MGYRIYFGIINKKDLDKHITERIARRISEEDDDYNDISKFTNIELNENTPIENFKKLIGYEGEEYPPYVLEKEDVQIMLNYYKEFLWKNFSEKEKKYDSQNIDKKEISATSVHFHYLSSYFEKLIMKDENIGESGIFLLDYFYLVKLYENMKKDDLGLITHG